MNSLKINTDNKLKKVTKNIKCLRCNGIGLIKRETMFRCENCLYDTIKRCYRC